MRVKGAGIFLQEWRINDKGREHEMETGFKSRLCWV